MELGVPHFRVAMVLAGLIAVTLAPSGHAQSPTPTPPLVISATTTLTASTPSVDVGQTITLTATVRNDSSPGVGFAPPRFQLTTRASPGESPLLIPVSETRDAGGGVSVGQSVSTTFTLLAVAMGVVTPRLSVSFYEVCLPPPNTVCSPRPVSGTFATGPAISIGSPPRTEGLGLGSFQATWSPAALEMDPRIALTWRPGTTQSGYRLLRFSASGASLIPENGPMAPDAASLLVSTAELGQPTCFILMAMGEDQALLDNSDAVCVIPAAKSGGFARGLFTVTTPGTDRVSIGWTRTDGADRSLPNVWLVGGPSIRMPSTSFVVPVPAGCFVAFTSSWNTDALCSIPAGSPDPSL